MVLNMSQVTRDYRPLFTLASPIVLLGGISIYFTWTAGSFVFAFISVSCFVSLLTLIVAAFRKSGSTTPSRTVRVGGRRWDDV